MADAFLERLTVGAGPPSLVAAHSAREELSGVMVSSHPFGMLSCMVRALLFQMSSSQVLGGQDGNTRPHPEWNAGRKVAHSRVLRCPPRHQGSPLGFLPTSSVRIMAPSGETPGAGVVWRRLWDLGHHQRGECRGRKNGQQTEMQCHCGTIVQPSSRR